MVDVSKLSAEQLKMFNEFKVNGLSAEEMKKLEQAGVSKEILNEMKADGSWSHTKDIRVGFSQRDFKPVIPICHVLCLIFLRRLFCSIRL